MVLPLTLVLIGVAFTGVYSHEQAMRGLVQERDQALVVVSANRVRDLLNLRVTALEMLAAQEAFHHQDRAAQRDLLAQAGDLPAPGTQAQMRRLFVGNIVLVDKTGDLITSSTAPPAWTQDERLSSLARTVMAHQDVSLTPPTDTPWGEDIFLLGVPIYNETGPIYGALVGPVSLGNLDLETLLSQVQVGKHGMAYLVNASGQVLAHAPADSLAGPTCLGVVLQAAGAGTALCQAPDGEWITLAYAPVDFYVGWRVLVEQPWREVIGSVLRYSQFMPLVAALAAVISLLTLYYGIRSIVRPLQALGQRAERVAWGDFDATSTSVGGVEEIEDLRRTLDQMAKRIQSYQSGMHDYIAAITRGQEEERERLARELHDDTTQALIALGQRVEMAQKLLSTDPDRAAQRLARVRTMLNETVEGVRRFSRDLRPIYLEDLGFIPALEMLSREANQQETLSVHFTTTGRLRRLPPDMELAAYRIVQEALNNVIQHARATHAQVEVLFEAGHLILSVRDDGQGFDSPHLPDALARRGHFGLMGIQERALLYGGQLTIHSEQGEGTEIRVLLPYPSSS